MNECREAFEKWLGGTSGWKACKARLKPMGLRKTTDGIYTDFRVNDRWCAWQAAWNYKEKGDEASDEA